MTTRTIAIQITNKSNQAITLTGYGSYTFSSGYRAFAFKFGSNSKREMALLYYSGKMYW